MKKTNPLTGMGKGLDPGEAMAEANRCLLCHDAPCSKGCPGGTDPGAFIRKFRLANTTGAIRTIKQNNILGGACGVLCPAARLCEKECVAAQVGGRAVRIGQIQRYLVEHGRLQGFFPLEAKPARAEKIAVVGSGPAGLTCAAELAKEGFQVTVFEARAKPGGVLRYGVPSYRFDPKLLDGEIEDVLRLGVKIECNRPIEGRGAAEALLEQGYDAVFLAPGLWAPVRLSMPTEVKQGALTSTDYLEGLRAGKVPEMEALIKDRRVAVVGGGSVAIDCAESAVRLGARDVYLIYRRSYTQMPAEEDEKQDSLRTGIHFLLLNQPVDYVAGPRGRLRAVKLIRTELGDIDASGRRRPVEVPGTEWELPVDVVIEAIGTKPAGDVETWVASVKRTKGGLIAADPTTGATSVKRIFAGGDIVRGPALIIEAVKDGKAAADAIQRRLGKKEVSHG